MGVRPLVEPGLCHGPPVLRHVVLLQALDLPLLRARPCTSLVCRLIGMRSAAPCGLEISEAETLPAEPRHGRLHGVPSCRSLLRRVSTQRGALHEHGSYSGTRPCVVAIAAQSPCP